MRRKVIFLILYFSIIGRISSKNLLLFPPSKEESIKVRALAPYRSIAIYNSFSKIFGVLYTLLFSKDLSQYGQLFSQPFEYLIC